MCDGSGSAAQARAAYPRPIVGDAVDPIRLEPVDAVRVTTLVDNSFDGLMSGGEHASRPPLGVGWVDAPLFSGGRGVSGMVAEHGFSALVTIVKDGRESSLLFDAGLTPDAMTTNADRLGLDLADLPALVLSHGHFDHIGGLNGLARTLGPRRMPMTVHPEVWTRRRLAVPGDEHFELPVLSRRALEGSGFEVIERRTPSLLFDGSVLITGEVDRTTDYERGMPPTHEAFVGGDGGGRWEPDPWIVDDQALIVHVRDRGLVVLTGCGHAGAVNIVRYASRLVGGVPVCGLIGGLHLTGDYFTPVVEPTVAALAELPLELLVPGHCTGWRAQHRLAAALPDAWTPGGVGSTYSLGVGSDAAA